MGDQLEGSLAESIGNCFDSIFGPVTVVLLGFVCSPLASFIWSLPGQRETTEGHPGSFFASREKGKCASGERIRVG